MPADLTGPDRPDGQAWFRADLAAYLDSLLAPELAELLGALPSSRQEPLRLGVLMVALNERLPTSTCCSRPPGSPAQGKDDVGRCGSWLATGAPPALPAGPGHAAPASRSGSGPGHTAGCRPPTRPWSGGWGRRCAATPPSGTSRPRRQRCLGGPGPPAGAGAAHPGLAGLVAARRGALALSNKQALQKGLSLG
jgi:hypothetical protein